MAFKRFAGGSTLLVAKQSIPSPRYIAGTYNMSAYLSKLQIEKLFCSMVNLG